MKRTVALALVFLLLFSLSSAYGAAPGSASDPLISQSYIADTFIPMAAGERDTLISGALGALYSDTENKIRAAYEGYLARLGGLPGYTFAPSFTPISLPQGATAGLITGSTFVLLSGTASMTVNSGTMINLSTGREVGSASSLEVGQRYFCAEDTSAVFTATSSAVCQIDGFYTTTGTAIVSAMPFLDVRSGEWYYDAVSYVTSKSYFSGTSTATFTPQGSMTRGMFVTVLYRLAGKPSVSGSSAFPDVSDPSAYYYKAVVWSNANSIVTGHSDGKFHPDDSITREQMAVIISRYAAYAGYSTSPAGLDVYSGFPDKSSVSDYAVDALKWATSVSIINGSDGRLLPQGTASRAQVAQIVLNFSQKIIGTS